MYDITFITFILVHIFKLQTSFYFQAMLSNIFMLKNII